MDFEHFSSIFQAGGLIAFAWVVWAELKTQRSERATLDTKYHDILTNIRTILASIETGLLSAARSERSDAIPVPIRESRMKTNPGYVTRRDDQ